MKKFYIAAIAFMGLCLSSCFSRKEEPVEAEMVPIEDALLEDSLKAIADSTAHIDAAIEALDTSDPDKLEAGVKSITTQIENLYRKGDVETATKYLERLQEWYKANKDEVKKSVKDSKTISNLLKDAKEAKKKYVQKTDEVKGQVKEKAKDLKKEHADEIETTKEKAGEVKEKAKEKAKETVEKLHEAVKK